MKNVIFKKNRLLIIGFLLVINIATILSNNCYAQNAMVGSLGGEVVVSSIGTASYSIPIEVTPGTNGMQPNLSITYNSGLGKGMLGEGWTLSGLSAITRTQRNKYYDNAIGSINFDGNDRFALDGQRLIKLSAGNYIVGNAQYGTEIEDFTRVVLKGNVNYQDSMYFVASSDLGYVIEFGRTINSKYKLPQGGVFSWMVNKITDADGNYMTIDYGKDWQTGEIWPLQINYSGNNTTNQTTYANIQFQYITDQNVNNTYIGGNIVTTSRLLDKIVVKYGSVIVRQYSFQYEFDRSTRLKAVVLEDADGGELTKTTINWGNDLSNTRFTTLYGFESNGKYVMDYNGDNIPDMLLTHDEQGARHWLIKEGLGNGNYQATDFTGNIENNATLFTIDYNGNGIEGFGYLYQPTKSNDYVIKVVEISQNAPVELYSKTLQSYHFLKGDFLGCGGTQFVFIGNTESQLRTVTNSFNNSSFSIPSNSIWSVTDLNGNGKADIQIARNNYIDVYEYDEQTESFVKILDSNWLPNNPTRSYHGDFNGDGMIDYIYYTCVDSHGHWYMKISKGNDYRVTEEVPFNTYHNSSLTPVYTLLISDINGDGKDDIIQPTIDFNIGRLTLNTYFIRGFNTSEGLLYDSVQLHHSGITGHYDMDYQFYDYNGNGKNELIYTGSYSQTPVVINFPERREHNLVAALTNGYGATTSVEYRYCNSPTMGYLGQDGKRLHYPLVNKLRQPNGLGGITETTLSYGRTIFDFERRQMLGFTHFNSHCNGTNTMLEFLYDSTDHHLKHVHSLTYYKTRNETGGYIIDSSYWDPRDDPFYYYEILYSPRYCPLDYGRFLFYNTSTTEVNRLKNSAITNCYWLNAEGRVCQTTSTIKKAKAENSPRPWVSCDSTIITYVSINLPNGITIKKPSSVKTWNRRNGYNQTPFRQKEYSYFHDKVATETVSDSDGPVGVTTYTYNAFGLPVTETYTPYGMNAITHSFEYDTYGRFLIGTVDALDRASSIYYDHSTGWVTSEMDFNSLTTQYQHDALGRLTKITRPDQTTHNTSYHWNNNTDLSNAVYYIEETEAGTPNTKTYYDIQGRPIHTYCEGQGYNDIVYDSKGRMVQETALPYDVPTTPQSLKTWHFFEYDNYNRVVEENGPYTDLSYFYYDHNELNHHDYFISIVDNIRNTCQTKTYDAMGRLMSAEDDGGNISYNYSYETVSGQILDKTTVCVGNSDNTTIYYDTRGNRLSIVDPDAGSITNTYNVLNQLVSQTDANDNQTTYSYDLAGRVVRMITSNGTNSESVFYTYDNAPGKGVGKLSNVIHNGDLEREYVYDNLGRLSLLTVYDGVTPYDHQYTYDSLSRLYGLTYPDGFQILHTYNSYGELASVCNATDNSIVYAVKTRNKFRQPLICLFGNETGTEYTYDSCGMITGIKNGNYVEQGNIIHGGTPGGHQIIQYNIGSQYRNITYAYNNRGFIANKSDANANCSESYSYDVLDRLTSYGVNGVTAATFTYDDNGNITENSKVGSYTYSSDKPHAVLFIEDNSNFAIPQARCDVTYNLRNKPVFLSENGFNIDIDYDASDMRRHTVITNRNALIKNKTRISNLYEMETTATSARRLNYVYAEGRIVAVHVTENGSGNLYYVLTDHLGSWEKVLDEDKNTVQQTHFDPWGNRMSYTAWNTPQTQTSFTFDRGFTGHEHYDCMHIINANARLYDPVIGRFFSPDPVVQAPDFTQAYNRYSYCMNNPVMYSDPTGEVFGIDDIIVAAALGAIVNCFTQIVAGNVNNAGDFFLAAGVGALAGTAGAYAGSAVAEAINLGGFVSGAASGAVNGATSGFIAGSGNAWIQGASFGQGLKAGVIAGGIGLGSGALLGGLTQGFIDYKHGYSFWDGTKTIGTETVSISSNAEPITQLGDDDCLATTIEWTDHSLEGNMTYGEAKSFIEYKNNEALDLKSVYNYCSNKDYPLSYISEDASAADKYYAVYSKIKDGGRVIINENLGHVSGHAVGVRSATRTLYLSTKGALIPRYSFNVMDPFWGGYYNISQGMIRNAYRIMLIL